MLHDARSATVVCWHPDVGLQLSTVQGSPSSQSSGVPAAQSPARQVSRPLQILPSLHDASARHCDGGGVVVVEEVDVVGVVEVVIGGRVVVVVVRTVVTSVAVLFAVSTSPPP